MSTQRRAARWQRTHRTESGDPAGQRVARGVERMTGTQRNPVSSLPSPPRSRATGGTAPPVDSAWLATNSLFMDSLTLRRSGKTGGRGECGSARANAHKRFHAAGITAPRMRSPELILIPSGSESSPKPVPLVLTTFPSQAERYDGKRDLHLQHAA